MSPGRLIERREALLLGESEVMKGLAGEISLSPQWQTALCEVLTGTCVGSH